MPKQPVKMKTLAQNRAIFGLAGKTNCGHQDLRELAFDVTGGRTDSLKQLTFDEANGMIKRLGGRPLGEARRTVNHRRQVAGVDQIVSIAHLEKLQRLADGRGMSNEGLKQLCERMIKVEKPRTTKQCNKVIEAIKAMNKRDRLFGKKEVA